MGSEKLQNMCRGKGLGFLAETSIMALESWVNGFRVRMRAYLDLLLPSSTPEIPTIRDHIQAHKKGPG